MFRYFFKRLRARWRIYWNLCPVCNSDAPEMYGCWCCHGSREFPLSQLTVLDYKYAFDLIDVTTYHKKRKELEKEDAGREQTSGS